MSIAGISDPQATIVRNPKRGNSGSHARGQGSHPMRNLDAAFGPTEMLVRVVVEFVRR